MSDPKQQDPVEPKARPGKKKLVLQAVGIVAVLLAVHFTYRYYTYISTDDAYVQAHSLMISTRIAGTVEKVLVNENDKVKSGQLLALIDEQDYETAYDQAVADEASVQADLVQADKDFKRMSRLYKEKAVSRSQFDGAEARFRNLTEKLKANQSKVDQAKNNLGYTKIAAPEDGSIAKKAVEPGMVVPPGQALFGFVGSSERWVTANLKETQLAHVRPGQTVTVEVDAVPGKTFRGVVDSLSSSTGSTFTLLPPDNSTGNFTKVVQRVPVRIKLLDLEPSDIDRLAAGLSAVVFIKIR